MVPGRSPGTMDWWRRGDSCSAAFAAGWTMPSSAHADAERVMPQRIQRHPSARPERAALGESMSLYRAGLKLACFLPLGVTMPPSLSRRRRQAPPM